MIYVTVSEKRGAFSAKYEFPISGTRGKRVAQLYNKMHEF